MRCKTMAWILAISLALVVPFVSVAQDANKHRHHHYNLVDLGTLGGVNSLIPFAGVQTLNSNGTVIATADTSTPDPNSPNCYQSPGCLINHTLRWRNGIVTDLGSLPGLNSTFPTWINSRGWVVGFSENGIIDPLTGFPESTAVLWKDGQIIDLGTLGGNASQANAVNNRGQVVGGSLNTTPDPFSVIFLQPFILFTPGFFFFPVATQTRAFLWEDGVMQDLGTLGGPDSVAWYVNESGSVVGQSSLSSTPSSTTGVPIVDPFFWHGGRMVDIGNLGGTFGWPSDLNNRGQVVGAMNLPGDAAYHPFSWERGELKDLGTFGRDCGVANAVNEGGEIAGWACDQNAAVFAFRWKNGVMTNLGTVGGDPCSVANGINSEGQVVGESTPSPQCNFPPNDDRAVLWENGSAVDLNTVIPTGSGLELAVAFSINDRGEIDGNAVLPNGDMHAFVLIPCDEDHPGLEGCDYGLVDVTVQPSPSQVKPSPAVAGIDRAFTQVLDRLRSRHGRQYRYSGPTPPPK